MVCLLFLSFAAVVSGLPFYTSDDGGRFGFSEADYDFIQTLPRVRSNRNVPSGFKVIYIDAAGQIYNTTDTLIPLNMSAVLPLVTANVTETLLDTNDTLKTRLEIAGSPGTTYAAMYAAANVIARMTQYMPSNIFTRVATHASVGVFSKEEKLTIYPEYAHLANGDCGSSCTGTCHVTCTADGRKYENVAGVGGQRAVILDDNVLCTGQDPYHHKHNILAHEFTHTIHQYGLTSYLKTNITLAYQAAQAAATWTLSSYAMSNKREYFAEGATVFFGVNTDYKAHTGGMNSCGTAICHEETEGRNHLQEADPALFNILAKVFTDNHPDWPSGLTVCPPIVSVVLG